MRSIAEIRQLATEERRQARRPGIIECLDALLELTVTKADKPKTDRRVYMRNLMRERRAAEKLAKGGQK